MFGALSTLDLPKIDTGRLQILRREVDTILVAAILAVGGYLVARAAGLWAGAGTASPGMGRFLGPSAPAFGAAGLLLLWVTGALAVELSGITQICRQWGAIAAALFYVENAAPFVGLLECFISIVKALLAYSAAGGSARAQPELIANIAIALGASAIGCFVALCAHSLKAVVAYRLRLS